MFLPPPTSPFVQKPWVQLGAQTQRNSLAVVWMTPDVEPTTSLEYVSGGRRRRATVASRAVRTEGIAAHRVVTATLTGLKAGAPVTYRVMDGGAEVFSATTMAPKSDRQAYSFAVMGDCGRGTPWQAQVAAVATGLKPDFLMITGDIVYNDGQASEYAKNFFPYYNHDTVDPAVGSPLLRSILTVAVPGNHDIAHADLDKYPDGLAFYPYWKQPLNGPITDPAHKSATPVTGSSERVAAFRAAAGPSYPRGANFSFDYGNSHWTCLDANEYVDWTDAGLRAWVAEDLRKAKGKAWRFVSFHHPGFHSSKSHQEQKHMRRLADLFEDGGVDVVFSGHVHNYQRSFPIQVGAKRGASLDELKKDDWTTDRSFDGAKSRKPKGVIYVVDGAGGAPLYNADYGDKPELWKPFQATYVADFSLSMVAVSGRRFSLRQIDASGEERDRFVIEK